jgi:hypothetical protein
VEHWAHFLILYYPLLTLTQPTRALARAPAVYAQAGAQVVVNQLASAGGASHMFVSLWTIDTWMWLDFRQHIVDAYFRCTAQGSFTILADLGTVLKGLLPGQPISALAEYVHPHPNPKTSTHGGPCMTQVVCRTHEADDCGGSLGRRSITSRINARRLVLPNRAQGYAPFTVGTNLRPSDINHQMVRARSPMA